MFLLLLFNKSRYYNSCNNLTKQLNSKPVQIGSTRRQQNQFDSKIENCFKQVRKHCGEKEKNAGYQHFLLSHIVFRRVVKTRDCLGKGLVTSFKIFLLLKLTSVNYYCCNNLT